MSPEGSPKVTGRLPRVIGGGHALPPEGTKGTSGEGGTQKSLGSLLGPPTEHRRAYRVPRSRGTPHDVKEKRYWWTGILTRWTRRVHHH